MKKIILVRHAKSSWAYRVEDFDRPLKQRGIKDAHLIGPELGDRLETPDIILSSPAARALQTAVLVTKGMNLPSSSIKLVDQLYNFDASNLRSVLRMVDDKHDSVMLLSHNHGITQFANDMGDVTVNNVPTCGVVVIDVNIKKWSDLKPGTTEFTLFPKELK